MTDKKQITLPQVQRLETAWRSINPNQPLEQRIQDLRDLIAAQKAMPLDARFEYRRLFTALFPEGTKEQRNAVEAFCNDYTDWHLYPAAMPIVIAGLYYLAHNHPKAEEKATAPAAALAA